MDLSEVVKKIAEDEHMGAVSAHANAQLSFHGHNMLRVSWDSVSSGRQHAEFKFTSIYLGEKFEQESA